jgi:hydrogenase-1 operon protein HyaE
MNAEAVSPLVTTLSLPVQAPVDPNATSALVRRLADQFSAEWVSPANVDAWCQGEGDHVLLLAGDAVRFPEGQDVAVVLPELRRCSSKPFAIGVVQRDDEDSVARRFGCNRWPSLVFVRDGAYVNTLSGMHDWDVYLARVAECLAMPPSRAPSIGIPVVNGNAAANTCH